MSGHGGARLALGPLDPHILERMQHDYPKIEWAMVDSQHDVPHQAPDELVAHLRKFAGTA